MIITLTRLLVLFAVLFASDPVITRLVRRDREQARHDALAHLLDLVFILLGLWVWSCFQ